MEAVLWTAVALGALGLAFVVSLRWGHHVGRALGHREDEQLLLRILGLTLIVAAIAATGVDRVSTGWPTHDAPWLDIALDWRAGSRAGS